MQQVNRIEMIITSQEVNKVIKILEKEKAPGYSIINNVIGKSDHGTVSDDVDLGSSKLSNVFLICYCPQEKVEVIVEQIKPILNKYGGACYLSNATEIRALHCIA
jgi:nitrogen regulatory protein PII